MSANDPRSLQERALALPGIDEAHGDFINDLVILRGGTPKVEFRFQGLAGAREALRLAEFVLKEERDAYDLPGGEA